MRAMIMAAGLGTRLRPLTGLLSKPMVPVANRPALEHILNLVRRHGIREVIINLHHFPEAITSYLGDGSALELGIKYSFEEELLGTAGGVKNNEWFLREDTFLVMSGDALTDVDLDALVESHRRQGGVATLALKRVEDPSHYGVVVLDDSGRVTGFQEKPAREDALSQLCNSGIYVFEPEILRYIPAESFYDFGDHVFPLLLQKDTPFYSYQIPTYWNDVGNLTEYRRGNFDALRGKVWSDVPGREEDPGVVMGARSHVASSAEIVSPVAIGADCRIEDDVVLRGPAVVGDHSVLDRGCSLERTIIWGGVYVGRAARLTDTVVARTSRIGDEATLKNVVMGERAAVAAGAVVEDCHVQSRKEVDA